MKKIEIKKEAVYKEVAKLISCVEAHSEATGKVVGCQVTSVEDGPLEFFWREAYRTATSGVLMYPSSASSIPDRDKPDPKEVFTIELTMPSNFNELFTTLIQEEIHSFFVNSIASKLLLISRKDVAYMCEKQATSSLQNAHKMLSYRKRPVRVLPTIK